MLDYRSSERAVCRVGRPERCGRRPRLSRFAPARPAATTARVEPFHPQLEEVCALLRQPRVRLLSLLGAPGAGKSRLADAVTPVMKREFADGAVVVDLARIDEQTGVSRAIAEALRAEKSSAAFLVSELVAWCGYKHVLVVLDNCDDLQDGALVIARLLHGCPRLKILASARTSLRVRGEHRFSVRPRGTRRRGQPTDANRVVDGRLAGLALQPAVVPKNQEHRLFPLTRREQAVATLLALGFSNTQIAEELVISYRTAETHACRILRKLGLTSRNLVVNWALEHGLVMVASRGGVYAAA